MLKLRHLFLAGALSAGCIGSAVSADQASAIASIDDISGKILVNKGKGFVSARPGMEIHPGDRVIALDNASARIVYRNGCVTSLRENSLLATDGSGCLKQPVNPYGADLKLAAAIGGQVVQSGSSVPPRPNPVPLAGFTPNAALLTAGTLGVLTGVYAASQNDDKPISGQ